MAEQGGHGIDQTQHGGRRKQGHADPPWSREGRDDRRALHHPQDRHNGRCRNNFQTPTGPCTSRWATAESRFDLETQLLQDSPSTDSQSRTILTCWPDLSSEVCTAFVRPWNSAVISYSPRKPRTLNWPWASVWPCSFVCHCL